MAYPRLLDLEEVVKSNLATWLENALADHKAERGLFDDEIIENQILYWGEPIEKERTAPFKGAANIVIPLSAIAVETYHANTMQQLRALDNPVSVEPVSPDWVTGANPVEVYFNKEFKHTLNFPECLEGAILDIEKHGSGVAKTGYEKVTKWGVRTLPDGDEVEFPVVVKQGPVVYCVPLYRFMQPFSAQETQMSPWCGEEHETSLYEIDLMERDEFFYEGTLDKVKDHARSHGSGGNNKVTQNQQELENKVPVNTDTVTWYELCLSFDIEQLDKVFEYSPSNEHQQLKGDPKEIIVYYHRESRTIMGVRYLHTFDLRRPYDNGVYFPIEHRWRGVGICKQTRMFQYEVTAQHRQRLDNATVANMRMFKISKMSGYGPGEPIFPGKMWFLDNMDQLDTVQAGEVYGSSFNDETMTLQYMERRLGLGDLQFGASSAGTPGTATDVMARVKEGKKRFDYTNGNIRKFIQKIQTNLVLELAQHGPSRQEFLEVIDGAHWVKQFLSLPPEIIKNNLILNVTLTGEKNSDLVDRNNWTQVAGLFQQYGVGAMQLAMQIGNPELVQQLAMKLLVGSTLAFKQMIDSYKLTGSDRMVVKELIENGFGIPQLAAGAGGNTQAANSAIPGQTQQITSGGNGGVPGINPEQLMALANSSIR